MDMGPCPKVHSLQLRKEYPLFTVSLVFTLYGYHEGRLLPWPLSIEFDI
jgi:hypothetical protein